MRYWNRVSSPNKPKTRSRSIIRASVGSAPSQFGQRPMFSVPGPDQPPPEEGRLGSEAHLDGLTPTDESLGSESRTDLTPGGVDDPVVLPYSKLNVSYPPTEAQIEEALGSQPSGFIGFITDAGGAGNTWLCIKSEGYWRYELFSRAS